MPMLTDDTQDLQQYHRESVVDNLGNAAQIIMGLQDEETLPAEVLLALRQAERRLLVALIQIKALPIGKEHCYGKPVTEVPPLDWDPYGIYAQDRVKVAK